MFIEILIIFGFSLLFIFWPYEHVFSQNDISGAQNPIIWADVPDPSVIRVNETYYMSSTTMHMNPGVPIMKSRNLINWEIINYCYDKLADNDELNLKNGKNAYGEGTWASSLRYHEDKFFISTFSNTTGKTYIYQTEDIEKGSWEEFIIDDLYHDNSLLFDNDEVYLVYGSGDIRLVELTSDVTGIKPQGVSELIIKEAGKIADSNIMLPAEGSHIHKINEKYYIFLITWPAGGMRTQICYRADNITGPYEGKVVLSDSGIAQGGLVDTPGGDWYALLFKDQGSVGRVPYLIPVIWENGWPVLGDNGQVPQNLDISAENRLYIAASDEFEYKSEENLSLVWQWNHNPNNDYWSVTECPGNLRLINDRVDPGLLETRNTLTQRTYGPQCAGETALDISNMKDGDYAGLGALQENYGFIGVKKSGEKLWIVMVRGSSDSFEEIEKVFCREDRIYLKIDIDYRNMKDKACFYYSFEGKSWNVLGSTLQMFYTLSHFMGYRFALFNFATKKAGGYVDFDYFRTGK